MVQESGAATRESRLKLYKTTLLLAYQSFGVVYGDLCTSPIYVFKSTFSGNLQLYKEDHEIFGVLSLVFWTLTIIPLCKYIIFVLGADDNGEGGTFALYSLLCRRSKMGFSQSSPMAHGYLSAHDYPVPTKETRTSLLIREFFEKHHSSRVVLLLVVLLGTSMVIGDGILTLTMSVLSAVYGIQIKVPNLHENYTVAIACVVLVGLFALQHYGTHRVGFLFAPILLAWLLCLGGVGIYNIFHWNPGVVNSLSPYYIHNFFQKAGKAGWSSLGGIVLCVTGAEAMFADLGHFSQLSIRIAFTVIVYPCLVLAYMGEAAYLSKHKDDLQRSFYKAIPEVIFWPVFLIATLATMVGSQAIISATFSIINQSRALGCFPRVKIVHTSNNIHGQIYIPEVNWLLMLLCLAVVVGFRDTAMVANAYGLAVVIVMFVTTLLMFLVISSVWNRNVLWAFLFVLIFGFVELCYFSACLAKVHKGGWLSLVVSLLILSLMSTWHYGTSKKLEFELENKVSLDSLLSLGSNMGITRIKLEFELENKLDLKHSKTGTVAMASAGENLNASQFYFTLRDGLDYLDGKHTVFGEVAEGLDTLTRINEAYVDEKSRPYKNIRIKHTYVLDDPFDDPSQLAELIPNSSPEGKPKDEVDDEVRLEDDWVPMDETLGAAELEEVLRSKEAHSSAVVLERSSYTTWSIQLSHIQILYEHFDSLVARTHMASSLPGDSSHHGANLQKYSPEKPEEGGRWYFSRKEIEENSPSRRDGIDLKKETYLRKSYCTFLQDLGMRLKVPQLTIATAIIFCHRFFLRQSHAKNDRRTIATVCMFLAGKVEETPRPLKDVILVSYEIIHKKDPEAVQRIKQKEVYEQQKELILLGERVVLASLGFDLNVQHPYKPLVDAIKKFKVAQNAFAQVAWNFVNDGLRTSLCLQFKPHHIAAGAIFLAAKFLKVKLPSDGEKVWWQEFDVTPRQLEEVSNQMLELYEQNRPSTNNEAEGSTAGTVTHQNTSKASSGKEEHAAINSHSQAGGTNSRPGTSKSISVADNRGGAPRTTHNQGNEHLSGEMKSASDHNADGESSDYVDQGIDTVPRYENMGEAQNTLRHASHGKEDQERNVARSEISEAGELKDRHFGRNLENREGTIGQSPQDAIKKIDRDKVKAALEKRKKSRGDVTRKTDFLDEDDLIERELEAGIELAAESEKSKRDRKQSYSKPLDRQERENPHYEKHQEDAGDGQRQGTKGHLSRKSDLNNMEEGEVPDDMDQGFHSPKLGNRKRKSWSPPDKVAEGKHRNDYVPGSHHYNNHDYLDDRNRMSRLGYVEREH